MATRREIKQEALARVSQEKARKRERRLELQAMTPEDRKAAKTSDRAASREARAASRTKRKAALSTMTRKERRELKRRERVYQKVKHRPRRIVGWSVLVAGVTVIAVAVAPAASDLIRVTSIPVDSATATGESARENAEVVAEAISDEGIVLLQNDDDLLPLTEKTVNVFGFESFNLRYGGGGSGGGDLSQAVTLYDALQMQGISFNADLKSAMEDAGAKTETAGGNGLVQIVQKMLAGDEEEEPTDEYLTDEVLRDASSFSSTALMVVGNAGVEGSDFDAEDLALSDVQRHLLDRITGVFDDVILVVNSGNQMELGFIEEYPQIKATLWIGTPGPRGAVSLAKALSGDVNPSGHVTSTYAYDVLSAPSTENFGDYQYENTQRGLVEYEEGIYVGYRFYETFHAGDEDGYRAAVQFPFGHGLSYTEFDWAASAPRVVDDQVVVDVSVTNAGAVAGKDVVQVYFSAPYTPGGVEKSAIELGGFAKTSTLEPGQTEAITIAFPVRDMSSWVQDEGAYVLDPGSYDIVVASDVHTPLATYPMPIAERTTYETDERTGAALANRFDDARGAMTTLSRSDWEGTYPDDADVATVASDELLAEMRPEIEPMDGDAPTYGADNGLMLEDLAGLEYDDPRWDEFLDQFTRSEQIDIFARGGYRTQAVERLGVPSAVLLDGPAGLNSLFSSVTAASYPNEAVIASTWNVDLAREMGVAVGTEANAYGVQGWYAPGMNIHRTAMGGRNFEYYSEDPLVSGRMGAAMVAGAQSRDVLTFMKHFALNEQETNARSGVHVWIDEQALREIYLRPFEITVKEGDANGAMSSFVHIGARWSGGNEQLLQEVLRGEWGFSGVVSSDAVLGGFMDPGQAARHGNDLMLTILGSQTVSDVEKAIEEDPAGMGRGLRDRVHAVMFALLQTDILD